MKKLLSIVLALVMVSTVVSLSGCSEPPVEKGYKVSMEEFYFSTDNGATYGNRKVEFEVGKSVYMQVVVSVENKDPEDDKIREIQCQLTIPNITSVDAYYLKGQKITPEVDAINGITTYPFVVTTGEEWEFFFEFVPNTVGSIEMELVFDDNVSEKYDMTNTIKFVEPKETEVVSSAEETTEGD